MKPKLALLLASTLTVSLHAQVEVLPPDFILFGKTSGGYLAEWMQHIIPLSTNGDYLLPKSIPSETDPVYFLQRPLFSLPVPGIQTYFLPDDVYVCFPIVFFWGDNVDVVPGFTAEELRDGVNSIIDVISGVHASIDGTAVMNLQAYRTESPVFSLLFPSSDNFYTVILGHPLEGIVDPVVAAGYLLMLKPLPAGLHDFRVGATIGGPNNFSFERHFQVRSLSLPEQLAGETEELLAEVEAADISANRKRVLEKTLLKAIAAFEKGKLKSGIHHLRAFQHHVRALLSRSYPDLAQKLIREAKTIMERAGRDLRKGSHGHDDKDEHHESKQRKKTL
jgi:hypothetical protein